ncbi:hypothetical protein GCM10018793_03150 [Streptomyces sulfonofaciens]|uniref:Uncharacterized protein n=1 Tax=Streptomyces sulfonofaciens TaxID=68272 RepID=A0A919FQ37_9ACTN|nr:hypothetical protein GCM10018793_03150 [Streptomyces sulfonofaciens]
MRVGSLRAGKRTGEPIPRLDLPADLARPESDAPEQDDGGHRSDCLWDLGPVCGAYRATAARTVSAEFGRRHSTPALLPFWVSMGASLSCPSCRLDARTLGAGWRSVA